MESVEAHRQWLTKFLQAEMVYAVERDFGERQDIQGIWSTVRN